MTDNTSAPQSYLERLGILIQASHEILAAESLADLLENALSAACSITGARMGILGQFDTTGAIQVNVSNCEPGIGKCPDWEQLKISEGIVAWDLIHKKGSIRLTSQQLIQHPDWIGEGSGNYRFLGLLGASLVGKDGAVAGLILLTDKIGAAQAGEGQAEFTADDESLLLELAAITSIALQNLTSKEEAGESQSNLESQISEHASSQARVTTNLQAEIFERMQVEETLRVTIESLEVAEEGLRAQNEELSQFNLQILDNQRVIESEQHRYQDLFEFAPDGYLITDTYGTIREANRAVTAILNLPKEKLLGKNLLSFVHLDEHKIFLENLEKVQGASVKPEVRPHRWETLLRTREIYTIPIALTVDVQLNNRGDRIGLRWILRDISERKKAEEELERTHALLEKVFSSVDVLIAYLDPDFNFQQVNRAYASAVNQLPEFFVGKSHFDLYPNPENKAIFRKVVKTGEPFFAFDKPFEYSGIPEKGITYWDWSLQPVKNENGIVTGLVLSLVDITERHRAEDMVRKNAERNQALSRVSSSLVEAGPDYQAVLNIIATATSSLLGGASVIRLASEDGSELVPVAFYHSNPEMLGWMGDLLHTLPNKPDENLLSQVFSTNEPILIPDINADPIRSHLIPNFDKLRKKVDFSSVVIVPMSVRNKVLGTIGLSRESSASPVTGEDLRLLKNLADLAALAISNSRLYQQLERALRDEQALRVQLIQSEKHRAVSRMVASVAHEINNPIQTVRNCLYLTQQDLPADSNIHEYINMAFLESQRISNLVTQLREVYRPQRIAQVEPVDLVVILDEVHQFTNPHLLHEKVEWCQPPATHPVLVSGIADQLKQVFLNICMNAIEAMQPSGGDLFVDLEATDHPGQAHVSFRDTGPGIPLGLLDQIFEPFFTTKEDGTGLGLSICYDVVRSHSGQITVESQTGEGATFTVILPLAVTEGVDAS